VDVKEFPMRVRIDDDLCTGHGRCYTLAPSVFDCDDSGFGQVRVDGDLDPDLAREAELAAANCPERAVLLIGEAPTRTS
jgi:ferredoxin